MVRLPLIAGCLLTFLPLAQSSLSAGEPNKTLILQLGHADFSQRVAAERAIQQLGAAGLDTAELGLRSDDAEVRQRSRRLITWLRQSAYREDREAVREQPWVASHSTAPGWELYQQLAGDSAAARDLFVEMIDAEPELLLALIYQPQTWTTLFERRCAALKVFADPRPGRELSSNTVAALLFLSIHPENKPSQDSANLLSSLVVTSAFNRASQSGDRGEILKELLNRWIESSTENLSAHHRLALAKSYDLPGANAAAREILQNRLGLGRSRMQLHDSIRYLGRHGGPEAIADLQAFLDDEGCGSCRLTAPVLLAHQTQSEATAPRQDDTYARDAALTSLLQLTGQAIADYGMQNQEADSDYRYGSISPSFSSDSDRRAAFDRWNQWRSRNASVRKDLPREACAGMAL